MPFGFGGPQFDIDDAKIASWVGDGTYGTALDVYSVQMVGAQVQTRSGTLSGDGRITDAAAKPISAQVMLRFGGMNLEVLGIITGRTYNDSGSTPNRHRHFRVFGGKKFPYWGLAGKVEASATDGDSHIFIPKCKCMEGFEVRFEEENYVIPELTCMALPDDNYTDVDEDAVLVDFIEHETAVAVALPPVGFPEAA